MYAYAVYLNAATASYLYVLEWAGTSPSANHASPKATFTQLDFDQFAQYIYITLFHQLNGSIKIRKKHINKYNTTKKKEKEEKNKNLG